MAEAYDWTGMVEATLMTLLDASLEGLLVFDAQGSCRLAGRHVGKLFGYDSSTLVGKSRGDVLAMLGRVCVTATELIAAVGARELPLHPPTGEIEVRTPRRVVVWSLHPIAIDGAPAGRLLLLRDVTTERNSDKTRRQLAARIEQLTPVDALTGLANRRRFGEEHEREHGRAMRAWDSYAVLMADVDGMRTINESFGLIIGDAVLERIAEVLRGGRREYDLVARLQDDEFAILLPGADSVALHAVGQRIRAALARTELADGPEISVCLGGAVCAPPTGETAADILRRCRDALAVARARGKGELEIDAPAPAPAG